MGRGSTEAWNPQENLTTKRAQNLEHRIVVQYLFSKEVIRKFWFQSISNISRDILYSVMYHFSCKPRDIIISLTWKEIFQKGKCQSFVFWKAVQLCSKYFHAILFKDYLAPGEDWCGDSPFVIAFKLLIFSCHRFISIIWSCMLWSISKLILL